ncbi:MAG: hypothetical protein QXX17_04760 [Conexivisphaerales archaeon]
MELKKKMKVVAVTHTDPRMHVVPPELRGEEIYLVLQETAILRRAPQVEAQTGQRHVLAPPVIQIPETVVTLTPEEYNNLGRPGIDTEIEITLKSG